MTLPDRIRYLPGTLLDLGPANVVRKAWYTVGVRTRIHPGVRVRCGVAKPPFYRAEVGQDRLGTHPGWADCWWAYGRPVVGSGRDLPGWHGALGNAHSGDGALRPWWAQQAFRANRDIKDVWEFSRLDWLLCMAQRVRCGDESESRRLREWFSDWVATNPPYLGPNWMCAQEAGLRVLHLALTAIVLGEDAQPEPGLMTLVETHLRRIAPTTEYAIAQQNNHATSEAAALFVGGSWLRACGHTCDMDFESIGRRLLERAVEACTCDDGTLSQYSLTYQRLFLDTMSVAELWRVRRGLAPFPERLQERVRCSVNWLDCLTDPISGDAPNIGGNDGAMLLPIGPVSYRNFRPCVRLAGSLFGQPVATEADEPSREQLKWLGVPEPQAKPAERYRAFRSGGFAVSRGTDQLICMRLPVFKYRPAHADALHVDVWINGINVIRDSGSYRYSGDAVSRDWFPSTAAHSTIEFDGRSQMPRISRFLFGAWIRPSSVAIDLDGSGLGRVSAGYRDTWGACHTRTLRVSQTSVEVEDELTGFRTRAVLRWHLGALAWRVHGGTASANGVSISVVADGEPVVPQLEYVDSSIHYGEKTSAPVLKAAVHRPCTIRTLIERLT
jgi:hypothetical protein